MKRLLLRRVALIFLLGLFYTTSWSQVSTFDYSGDMVSYTVPPGATQINITALGAQGAAGDAAFLGGLGASMSGNFTVTPGDVIILAVGGAGLGQSSGSNGGGGGGSFAVLADPGAPDVILAGPFSGTAVTPLVIAGGGGGTRDIVTQDGNPGVTGMNGTTGSLSVEFGGGIPSAVTPGNGGLAPSSSWGSGGGGFSGNGAGDSGYGNGGNSFLNGAAGGTGGSGSGDNAAGGFGGGGQGRGSWGGGGGGGYTGGDGGRVGGGGGSYNVGDDQVNTSGVRSGNGQIIITVLCDGLVPDISAVEICEGEEVTLEAVSVNGGTVTWDGGVIDGVAFVPPVGLNTYNATSDNADDCSYTVDILVNPNPSVTLAVTSAIICEDQTVVFTYGGDADTYSYDPIDVINDAAYSPAMLGLSTYTVTGVNDATGCENEASVDVFVNPVPTVDASSSESEICEGESIILTKTGDADSYVWDPADIVEGIPYTPADGVDTYTLTGTFDDTGCSTEDVITITLNPTPEVSAGAGDGIFCINETIVLAAGGDADIYTWDPTDLEPGLGTHTYTVTGTYDGFEGCPAYASVTVTVMPTPEITVSTDFENVCVGQEVTLTASGADVYEWMPGSIENGVGFVPGAEGVYSYSVIGTISGGCTAEETITINVVEAITLSLAITPEMLGSDGEIDLTVTGGVAPYTYEWKKNGSYYDDTEDLTGLSFGGYAVTVVGATGCSATDLKYIQSNVGVDEFTKDMVKLYPNPTSDNVTIQVEGAFTYTLTDISGAVLLNGSGNNSKTLSLDEFADGIYFVTLNVDGEFVTMKVVKH